MIASTPTLSNVGCDRDRPDDVRRHQELKSQQDGASQQLPVRAVDGERFGAFRQALRLESAYGHGDGDDGADHHNGDAGKVHEPADGLDNVLKIHCSP